MMKIFLHKEGGGEKVVDDKYLFNTGGVIDYILFNTGGRGCRRLYFFAYRGGVSVRGAHPKCLAQGPTKALIRPWWGWSVFAKIKDSDWQS